MNYLNLSSENWPQKSTTCCFSGYRPHKFGFLFSANDTRYSNLLSSIQKSVEKLCVNGCKNFICGGAMGFDILCGEAIMNLKKQYDYVKLYCILPFEGQEKSFTNEWKQRFTNLIGHCDGIYYCCEDYERGCYGIRNRKMVDSSDYLITYYSGKSGGTAQTVAYAEKNGLKITNICDDISKQISLFDIKE